MGKRNLMSMNENGIMRAYRRNPAIFREVLETAEHEHVSRDELKNMLVNETKKIDMYGGEFGGVTGVIAGGIIGAMTGAAYAGLLSHSYKLSPDMEKLAIGLTLGTFIPAASITLGKYLSKKMGNPAKLKKEYKGLKKQADKNLGFSRVRGDPQLEFLFD